MARQSGSHSGPECHDRSIQHAKAPGSPVVLEGLNSFGIESRFDAWHSIGGGKEGLGVTRHPFACGIGNHAEEPECCSQFLLTSLFGPCLVASEVQACEYGQGADG